MNHAAELDENDIVIRVIVGAADWAEENLGGRWVASPKCGPGWLYVEGEFLPPERDES
jgi:hypothetical protein